MEGKQGAQGLLVSGTLVRGHEDVRNVSGTLCGIEWAAREQRSVSPKGCRCTSEVSLRRLSLNSINTFPQQLWKACSATLHTKTVLASAGTVAPTARNMSHKYVPHVFVNYPLYLTYP